MDSILTSVKKLLGLTEEYTAFDTDLTVIDTKPDSEMTAAMGLLAKASHDRHFISDNLYHDVFSVWY